MHLPPDVTEQTLTNSARRKVALNLRVPSGHIALCDPSRKPRLRPLWKSLNGALYLEKSHRVSLLLIEIRYVFGIGHSEQLDQIHHIAVLTFVAPPLILRKHIPRLFVYYRVGRSSESSV